MLKPFYHCPFCQEVLLADTASEEEFSCSACDAMVDILDEDLTMVSRAPHDEVFYVATRVLERSLPVPSLR